MVTLRYFAWVRERIGTSEELINIPESVTTAGALVDWLSARSSEHAYALADGGAVRIAINQEHVERDAPLAGAREVAFFPPMTGG